jgi:hypothetical protein
MDLWRLTTLDLLVEHANRIPPPDFSESTLQAAELGDEGEMLRTRVDDA